MEINEVLELVQKRIMEMRMGEVDSDLRGLAAYVQELKTPVPLIEEEF